MIILGFSLRQYLKTRLRIILYFMGLPISMLMAEISIMIYFGYEDYINIIAVLLHISILLMMFTTTVFVENFEGEISFQKTGTIGLLLVITAYNGVVSLQTDNISLNATLMVVHGITFISGSPTTGMVITLAFALCSYWVIQAIRKSDLPMTSHRQAKNLKLTKLGLFITIPVSFMISIPGVIAVGSGNDFMIVIFIHFLLQLSLAIGITVTAYGYLSLNSVAFLQPQKFDNLIVINDNGLPLYRYDFHRDDSSTDTVLISGAITAITALMSEAFDVQSKLKSIHFGDKDILVVFQKNVAFLLISSRITEFGRYALTRFSTQFYENYKGNIESTNTDVTLYEKADELIQVLFGLKPIDDI